MKKRLLIFDTSMLVVWLDVPGMNRCDSDDIGHKEVVEKITLERKNGTHFILPLAVLIETGNHISQIKSNDAGQRKIATQFIKLINDAINGQSPWIVFSNQIQLFENNKLMEMLDEWFNHIHTLSIGDVSVKRVADLYQNDLTEVVIYTCDHKLRAYSPVSDVPIPRRRR